MQMPAPVLDFLAGGGQMERRIRTFDWDRTPLGPPQGWPQSLKTALKIALNSRYPIWLGWGRELINLYNDPYIPVLGRRDEWALGASAREVWREIWDEHLGPQADAVLVRGEATWNEQRQMVMYRNGYAEETYFTFSFSPLPTDEGGVGGLFCACTEDTLKVLGERRLAALRQLAADTADERTEQAAATAAACVLEEHGGDVAFALIYLIERGGETASLAASTGNARSGWAPHVHPLTASTEAASPWPLLRAQADGKLVLRNIPGERRLPGGIWPEPAGTVAVLPLGTAGHDQARGFLVVGASPRLPFDDSYESFFDLLARSIADALSNARAYEDEKKRAEALAELDRAKTAFFSNVSHEFRTPLTLMLGPVAELLQKMASLPDQSMREDLEIIHRNSLRLLRLVNSMLDFSRIEAGRARASHQPTDLATLTADLCASFRSACERAGLQLIVDCPPLPEPVYVDNDMWEKIVLNLLSNAFKFTLSGAITVRLHAEGGYAKLTVDDDGVGIPHEELPRMFERFHRVTQTRGRTHEGTGIGLALVQELAKLHGGEVSVTSTLGVGSTFTVRVPFGTAHLDPACIGEHASPASTATGPAAFVEEALRWLPDDDAAKHASLPQPGASPPALASARAQTVGRPRIVWADDNADMRAYVTRLLADRYEVETCADGEAALNAMRRHRPDLVLSDVMMPRLDGMGLLAAIRSEPDLADIPVILLSARAGEENRIAGAESGADDYLVKPFSAKELVARVEMHARLSRMRRESRSVPSEDQKRFGAFIQATSDVVYQMSPDWQEMRFLDGRAFIPDTNEPSRSWLEKYIPPEDRPQVMAAVEEAVRTESIFSLEHRVLRVDGTPGWTFSRAIPVRDARGRIVEWFGAASDVTARKEGEQALVDMDRRKDEFIATLSHELRNPLAPLSNSLHLLRLKAGSDPAVTPVREMMERQVNHLIRLVDDLLELSRISRGTLELRKELVDVATVVRNASETVEPMMREGGHRLQLSLPAESIWVDGDPVRLAQILANLLNNAARYSDPRSGIDLEVQRDGGHVLLAVQDQGIGIEPRNIPRLFEMFRRGQQLSGRGQGGLGIGLALAKRLAQMHGGSIEATSEGPGKGARFTVRLPVAGSATSAVGSRPSAADIDGLRVLVVDDNRDAATSLALLLQMLGAETRIAHDGPQALDAYDAFRPDVALLDIGMPGMDGYEVARRLSASHAADGCLLVAVTGWGQEEDRRRATQAGFDHHLVKPADLAALRSMLASVRHRRQR